MRNIKPSAFFRDFHFACVLKIDTVSVFLVLYFLSSTPTTLPLV